MDTALLETFVAVARARSFTAAARELGYVQSTVTGHIQALEQRLGGRLVDRLPSGAVLTGAGQRLMPYAEQLLALESRMRAEVAAGARRRRSGASRPNPGRRARTAPRRLHRLPRHPSQTLPDASRAARARPAPRSVGGQASADSGEDRLGPGQPGSRTSRMAATASAAGTRRRRHRSERA